jgi:hypothetical protein
MSLLYNDAEENSEADGNSKAEGESSGSSSDGDIWEMLQNGRKRTT